MPRSYFHKEAKNDMREYSKIFPQIWIGKTGKQIKSLGIESQLLAYYLMSSPHATMIGIYYLPLALIVHETGLPIEKTSSALQKLIEIDFCSYDETMEYVWVHNMAFNDNRVKNMNELYKMLPDLSFIKNFFEKYKEAFFLEKINDDQKNIASDFEVPLKPGAGAGEGVRTEIETGKNNVNHSKIYLEQANEILEFLNEKAVIVNPPTPYNLNLIIDVLKSGATQKECFHVITKKSRQWIKDEKMKKFIRPSTIFSPDNYPKYSSELVLSKQDSNND
jgi:uncharacterized phage protein (TIGR02220 family)